MRRIRPWFMFCRVYVREIGPAPAGSQASDGLMIRKATRDELLVAAKANPKQLSAEFVDDALANGQFCVGAFDGSRMVSWTWACFDTAPHGDGLCVQVEAPYEYGYKSLTLPAVRGQGVIGCVILARDQLCYQLGCTHIVGFVETHNYPSINTSKHLGSRRVGYAGYVKCFGRAYPFRTPGVVGHSFRFVRA